MGTAKFDDGLTANPKFIAAGATASWLWFCGVLFCRRGLTDGFIPKAVVPTLVIGLGNPFKYAARLVDVGLWEDAVGGFRIHDFLEWNPSKSAMNEYRRKDRERKHRVNGIHMEAPSGIRTESERLPSDGANVRGTHAGTKSESASESKSVSIEVLPEESARETKALAPVWNTGGRSRGLSGGHLGCYRSAACGRGICVPGWLGEEWQQQFGGDLHAADAEISQVITAALAVLPPVGPIGDVPKDFWRAVWKAAHGSHAPQSGSSYTKGNLTLDAARRFVQQRLRDKGLAS